ncbi:MAG: FAD:protein FMN transferase [Pseudomonadota bacterium]
MIPTLLTVMRHGLLLLFVLLSGCARPQLYEAQVYVFGTLADISVWGAEEQTARAAVDAVAADFQRMHHEWHAWEPGPLVDLNAAIAAGRPAAVPATIIPLIERSQEIYLLSEGRFNAGIGRLLNLWGFQSSERPSGPPPSREAIAALLAQRPAMTDLQLQDGTLYSSNTAVQLDFGGIAKGYAVELALQRLHSFGIDNAIVNAGGGLGVIGQRGERHWNVGIRHPQGQGILASLEVLDGEHVHTSGNYERFREHEGLRYAHILDPRTGWPVDSITSCTVISRDGTLADAAATALVIAGRDDWHRVAQKMGIKYVMLVSEDGTVYMNPAMAARVQFGDNKPAVVLGAEL